MSGHIAIIYEGDKREAQFWRSIKDSFFKNCELHFVDFPVGENIYMLWKQLKEDDFETDIIEIVREYNKSAASALGNLKRDDFQEVYLFFDYDPHHDDLETKRSKDKIIAELLSGFDNETENGKLYISYPMCEALRDFMIYSCKAFSGCYVSYDEIQEYKHRSGFGNDHADYKKYNRELWMLLLSIFLKRAACLHDYDLNAKRDDVLEWFKKEVTSISIHARESDMLKKTKRLFVLSAFPEFILDYYGIEKWKHELKDYSSIERDKSCEKKC